MCQLCLSPWALAVLSSSTACRKQFPEHAETILDCFKLKLWETIWFCVLIMKTHSFKAISITYMFLLGRNFPSFKIIHLVGWNHYSGRMCM